MNSAKHKIIKVCKIDSLSFASFAIKQNVDFLGIHILSNENIGEHKELIDFIKNNNGKPIVVTKIKDSEALGKLIEFYKPTGIQFHFEIQPELASTIKQKFPNLLLFGVITNQTRYLDFSFINTLHDYLIYDTSYLGGTNEKSSYTLYNSFPKELKAKTLLAGGITIERIIELNSLNACGYDIQSYFRTDSGLSFRNLDKVCDILKFPRKNMLSISLTDISLNEIYQASTYYLNSNMEYHLDFSDGFLYPTFVTIDKSIEEKQKYLTQLPYSIHLFIKSEKEIQDKIKILSQKYPLNLIRIFVQYSDNINENIYSSDNVKIIPSVFYKDLLSFISKSIDSPFLSIIVPKPESKIKIANFLETFNSHREYFRNKEIWFDRNLELDYIELLKKNLGSDFNFIIGKGVINDWSKINTIHEHLLK
jgi:phosphoribosylanthranilate isomerase